ncbi:isoform 2 of ankyrin repeat domain-containing protein 17 [Fagus crenata]
MKDDKLEALNSKENTALCYAAATGNVNIAKLMLKKNKDLANVGSVKPVFMAALLGHADMVNFLSPWTKIAEWDITEQVELFVTYASVGMYEQALDMLKKKPSLATMKNKQDKTALHVLALKPSAFVSGSQPGILRRWINSWRTTVKQDQNMKQTAHPLLQAICAHVYECDVENLTVNEDISELLFVAAKVGNVEFLVELIRTSVDLIWEMDEQKRTIFHIAVEERHKSIFNIMVNDIGSIKGILLDSKTEDGNNLLHLAAKLAPEHKLNAISGAALQMQQELLWFEEVKKVVNRPSMVEMENKKQQTPNVLFEKQHDDLRKAGEKWMRNTATSCMVVATLIGQIIFSVQSATSSEKPNTVLYLAFLYSSAITFFSSSTSIIIFMSILTSRYSYNDFLVSLPNRLLIGVTSLFLSIASMMVAFCASFCLEYPKHHGFPLIAVLFGIFAFLPILCGLLKYRLLSDIVRVTYCSSSQFQSCKHLLY